MGVMFETVTPLYTIFNQGVADRYLEEEQTKPFFGDMQYGWHTIVRLWHYIFCLCATD